MPSMRSAVLLSLASLASLASAQTTVYACTATLIIPTTVTNTVTSTRSTVQVSTVYSVATTTKTERETITSTVTRTQFGFPGGNNTPTTVYFPTTVTTTVGGGSCPNPTPTQAPPALGVPIQGRATNGGVNVENGSCSFGTGFRLPAGFSPASVAVENWNNAFYCGACLQVTSGGRSAYVFVTDQGGNGANSLVLENSGFSQLAPSNSGTVNADWRIVACNSIQGGLIYRAIEGSSVNYLAIQILNSKHPIREVSISNNNGRNWYPLVRQAYNVFNLATGAPSVARVDIRVTDVSGKTIQDNGVDIIAGSTSYGGGNF